MNQNDIDGYIQLAAFGLLAFVVLCGIVRLWWKYRVWRKEYQLTSMDYRGIPVDIGKGKK